MILNQNHVENDFLNQNSKQEAADMTNPRDAFRGQLRSPHMVPFDMLGIISY